jgi:hypothetical protein
VRSPQAARKLALVEVPVIHRSRDGWSSVPPDVPPVELLALAEEVTNQGSEVALIPAHTDDFIGGTESMGELATAIGRTDAEIVVLVASAFQWPAASLIARELSGVGWAPDRVIVAGPLPPAVGRGREDFTLADHRTLGGIFAEPDSARSLPTSSVLGWPRRTRALSLDQTAGFPLDLQPHPWNLPRSPGWTTRDDEAGIGELVRGLGSGQRRVIGLRRPPGEWTPQGLDFLGAVALNSLVDHDTEVAYHVRITPDEFLRPGVLESLGLLNLECLDLLAGSSIEHSLRIAGAFHDAQDVERCGIEVARAGLSQLARLNFVLGLPRENVEETLGSVRFAVRLALMTGIRRLRFEWWQNVPDSPICHPAPEWDERIAEGSGTWLEEVPKCDVEVLDESQRRGIADAIDLIRMLHALDMTGPDWFVGPDS